MTHQMSDRRSFLQVGTLGGLLASMPWFMQSQRSDQIEASSTFATLENIPSEKRCILIWLDGGPSHLEMFDPKPDAPEEVRGPFSTIPTPVAGVHFSELMPQLTRRFKDLAVIRSMTSPLGEHNLGTHYMLTGYKPSPAIEYPAFGSVLKHLSDHAGDLPYGVAIPNHAVGGSQFSPGGFLGSKASPFEVGGDPSRKDFRVDDLNWYPGLDEKRIRRRQALLTDIEKLANNGEVLNPQFDQAFRLLVSKQAKSAFDLSQESEKSRRTYGSKMIGQCCLMARRLVERGVKFVTVNYKGWDTHDRLVTRLRDGYVGAKNPVGLIPSLDIAVAALIDDLKKVGLFDETLVIVMGEFGRTPKLNVQGGRDHWPRAFSVMMAGGGVNGGVVYGETDGKGESPTSNPVTPPQLLATIYKLMGVDPGETLFSPDGRPIKLVNGFEPVEDLIS